MMTLKSPYDDIKAKAQVIELAQEAAGGTHTEHAPLHHNSGLHHHRDPAPLLLRSPLRLSLGTMTGLAVRLEDSKIIILSHSATMS